MLTHIVQAANEELEYLGEIEAQLGMLQAGNDDLDALRGIQVCIASFSLILLNRACRHPGARVG